MIRELVPIALKDRLKRWQQSILSPQRRAQHAKAFWRHKRGACEHAHIIDAAMPLHASSVLEFGANWGGNLQYLLQCRPALLHAVGIDINPVVTELQAIIGSRYQGFIGDERLLAVWDAHFNVAFTVSVFDHMADPAAVETAIENLIRLAPLVLLFEPWVAGVHQDVSHRPRSAIADDLPNPHKCFKDHCYLWNYDAMLNRMDVLWSKQAMPQHAFSLGPFYHLYRIQRYAK